MKISIRDLCSKCKQIRRKLRIFFKFTKKTLTEKFIMMADRLTVWSISWRSSILTIYVSVEAAFRRYSTWYVFLRTSPCWSSLSIRLQHCCQRDSGAGIFCKFCKIFKTIFFIQYLWASAFISVICHREIFNFLEICKGNKW